MKNIFIAIIVIGFLTTPAAYSQITIQAGGGFGIVMPQADYTGTTIDYYAGKKYGLSTGYNIHGKARFGVLGFTVFGELGYTALSNSGNSEPGKGKVEISHNIVTLKAGPEIHFNLPAFPIKPYIGGSVALNIFNGETIFNGVAEVPSGTYKINSTSRLGLGLCGGAIVEIGSALKLDLGIKYNMLNASGKLWEKIDQSKVKRIDSYGALNDDKDPEGFLNNTEHFIQKARTIDALSLSVTLMFGL